MIVSKTISLFSAMICFIYTASNGIYHDEGIQKVKRSNTHRMLVLFTKLNTIENYEKFISSINSEILEPYLDRLRDTLKIFDLCSTIISDASNTNGSLYRYTETNVESAENLLKLVDIKSEELVTKLYDFKISSPYRALKLIEELEKPTQFFHTNSCYCEAFLDIIAREIKFFNNEIDDIRANIKRERLLVYNLLSVISEYLRKVVKDFSENAKFVMADIPAHKTVDYLVERFIEIIDQLKSGFVGDSYLGNNPVTIQYIKMFLSGIVAYISLNEPDLVKFYISNLENFILKNGLVDEGLGYDFENRISNQKGLVRRDD